MKKRDLSANATDPSLIGTTESRLEQSQAFFTNNSKTNLESVASELFGTALSETGVGMPLAEDATAITCAALLMDLQTQSGYIFPQLFDKHTATEISFKNQLVK